MSVAWELRPCIEFGICLSANKGIVLSFKIPVEGHWVELKALDLWFGVENGNAKLCDPWRAPRQTGDHLGR